MDELVYLKNDEPVCSSLQVAEKFGKRHAHVIERIEKIIENDSTENSAQCFKASIYKDSTGKSNKMYVMNRDGFTFLVMGFTGKKANEWKWQYIKAFNQMEKFIREKQTQTWIETRKAGKLTRKAETDTIKNLVEYAKTQGSQHADEKLKRTVWDAIKNNTVTIQSDGTVSFQDSTAYSQVGSSYGAKEVNEEREAINNIYANKLVSLDEIDLVTEPGFFVDAQVVKELNSKIPKIKSGTKILHGTGDRYLKLFTMAELEEMFRVSNTNSPNYVIYACNADDSALGQIDSGIAYTTDAKAWMLWFESNITSGKNVRINYSVTFNPDVS